MPDLPDDIDPNLWFWSAGCDGRDYIYDSQWHTHPGRMSAYCPHRIEHPGYRISKDELPAVLPEATRYFVAGFLAGNLPEPPDDTDDPASPTMAEWKQAAARFVADGTWHVEADMDEPRRQEEAMLVDEATVLAGWGEHLEGDLERIVVVVPGPLADRAVEVARTRGHGYAVAKQHLAPYFADALMSIGIALTERGEQVADGVRVDLDVELLGAAILASHENWEV